MHPSSAPVEQSFWLNSGAHGPFVFRCAAPGPGPRPAFVFCPPFAEEKNKSHRLLVDLARAFAGRGVDVCLLDYFGTGDAAGDFQDSAIASDLADIDAAIDFCRRQGSRPIGLLGLRFGCALAAMVAARRDDVPWIACISPVTDASAHLHSSLRAKLVREMVTAGRATSRVETLDREAAEGVLDCDGFPITPKLRAEFMSLDVAAAARGFGGSALILDATLRRAASQDVARLRDLWQSAGAQVRVERADVEPFWSTHTPPPFERITAPALSWLDSRLRDIPGCRGAAAVPPETEPDAVAPATVLCTDAGAEEVFRVAVGEGWVSGIAHVPGAPSNARTAVVMLHGWGGYRIGPHLMLKKAARRFCAKGILCARVDLRGRGASSGSPAETSLAGMIEDARAVIDQVRATRAPARVVVLGQCRGGEAAFLCPGADACIVWGAPPLADSARAGARRTGAAAADYLRKAILPRTWVKAVRGKVNLPLVWEALVGHLRRGAHAVEKSARTALDTANPGVPCLTVSGERDPDTEPARAIYAKACAAAGRRMDFHLVRDANHGFYSLHWESEVIETTLNWLVAME